MKFSSHTFLSFGFRPFYLLAAIFAIVALPLWMGFLFGLIPIAGYLQGLVWHSHEMIFGFAAAVITGFLLTAVRNWTGRPTPTGFALGTLAGLWLGGRILVFTDFPVLASITDLAFLPAIGCVLAIPIWRSTDNRNFKILLVLAALGLINLVFHLAQHGILPINFARASLIWAMDVITILIAIMAGRIIPAFTANAVPDATPLRYVGVEVVAMVCLILVLIGDILGSWYPVPALIFSAVLITGAVAHVIRLALWKPLQTRHDPLLLMLPVAYAWLPIALALRATAIMSDQISASIAFHALTVGAMASLMMAMVTRSALGHTGRALIAGPTEIGVFWLLQSAAIARIMPPSIWPGGSSLILASALWSLAFTLFLLRYAPILTRPRIDSKPA